MDKQKIDKYTLSACIEFSSNKKSLFKENHYYQFITEKSSCSSNCTPVFGDISSASCSFEQCYFTTALIHKSLSIIYILYTSLILKSSVKFLVNFFFMIYVFLYYGYEFSSMHICAPPVCLVSVEARRGCWVLWNRSYR